MAGDWVPFTKELPRKQEVVFVAATTGRNRHEVIGILMEFWAWADGETSTGHLDKTRVDDLPGIVCGTDVTFWEAVIKAGWLRRHRDGLVITNFEYWMGKNAKARLQNNQRQKLSRFRRDKNITTVQNRTEENRTVEGSFSSLEENFFSLEKNSQGVGMGGVGGKEGGVDASPSTKASTKQPDAFDLTPAGLAQAFLFYQTPRRDKCSLEDATHIFAELLRFGADPQALLADIKGKDRRHSEYLWQYEKRWLPESEKNNAKPGGGVGSGARIPTPADSLARAEAKTIRIAETRKSRGGNTEDKA